MVHNMFRSRDIAVVTVTHATRLDHPFDVMLDGAGRVGEQFAERLTQHVLAVGQLAEYRQVRGGGERRELILVERGHNCQILVGREPVAVKVFIKVELHTGLSYRMQVTEDRAAADIQLNGEFRGIQPASGLQLLEDRQKARMSTFTR